MNDLTAQALKDIENCSEINKRNLMKLWLEKMYIKGELNALDELSKVYDKIFKK
jgi:hypothetical protein